MTKRIAGSIIEQVAVSEQMASVKFAGQIRANLVVNMCFAPTNEADDLAKDQFLESVEQLGIQFQTKGESLPRRRLQFGTWSII